MTSLLPHPHPDNCATCRCGARQDGSVRCICGAATDSALLGVLYWYCCLPPHSGEISRHELYTALRRYKVPINQKDFRTLFRVIDPDQTRSLQFAEWIDFMMATDGGMDLHTSECRAAAGHCVLTSPASTRAAALRRRQDDDSDLVLLNGMAGNAHTAVPDMKRGEKVWPEGATDTSAGAAPKAEP
eukprot:COSAG05_NODE_1958_length_3788_cov_2.302521_2_plen_186_part_00